MKSIGVTLQRTKKKHCATSSYALQYSWCHLKSGKWTCGLGYLACRKTGCVRFVVYPKCGLIELALFLWELSFENSLATIRSDMFEIKILSSKLCHNKLKIDEEDKGQLILVILKYSLVRVPFYQPWAFLLYSTSFTCLLKYFVKSFSKT